MSGSDSDDVTAAASRSRELLEDIDEAADELIDSVQYLQETMEAGEGVYESKWLGGVMRAHEMLLSVRGQLEHASAWPCDGEGDEHGNFVCRHISRNKPVALRIAIDDGWNYFDWQPGKAEKLRAKGQIVQELYDAPSPAAASRSREDGPSDEAIAQAIKATEYKYFGDYPMSDGQIDAVGVLVAAARALTRSRLNHAAAAEAPSSAERVNYEPVDLDPHEPTESYTDAHTPPAASSFQISPDDPSLQVGTDMYGDPTNVIGPPGMKGPAAGKSREIDPWSVEHTSKCRIHDHLFEQNAVAADCSCGAIIHAVTQDIRDFFKAVDSGWLGQMPSGFNQSAFVTALRSRIQTVTKP